MDSRIVILIGRFARGGSERQAYLLARELRQRHGLNVEVWGLISDGHDDQYAKEFEAIGVPTKALGFSFPQFPVRLARGLQWANHLQRITRQLRRSRVDVLLPFTTWPNVVAGLTYRLGGVQLCIWGERSAGSERVPTPERIAVKQYRRFVANSTAGVEFLAREMKVPRERISHVPNGVEEPSCDPASDWRGRLELKPTQPLVVMIANVTFFKDHATLLRAWKIVQDAWTEGHRPILALAGSHAEDAYPACQRIVHEAGLDSTVRFLGPVLDVPGLLHACDIAAFSSQKEGMPNGVLECMAAGKAVVATDLPGIRDALGPNVGDVLAPPGDANALARIILALLKDQKTRSALGDANRARTRTEFSVERMAERHLQVILTNLTAVPTKQPRRSQLTGYRERT